MIVQSKNIWMNETFKPAQIEIEDGKIKQIYAYGEKPVDEDYNEKWILPGFFDIHTHGWNKCDCNTPTLEGIRSWQKHMPNEGVTSFLMTTSTQSYEKNIAAMPILKEAIENPGEGAEILGINVEGNYISYKYRGAQDEHHIVKPNKDELLEYHELSGRNIKTVTCAVEYDENYEFVKAAVANGIRISMGHSGASFDEAKGAVENGATGVTHTGNGMSPLHHRNPGVFGAALNLDEIYAELIGDGIHINFEMAHIIGTMKGKDKLVLVTDSAEQKDDPDLVEFGKEGAFRLPDGTLFGSALYINKGVDNLHRKARLPLVTAINAATINPAKYLGVDDRKGSIEVGKDADLVVCNENIELEQVYCFGKKQLV